MTSGDPRHMTMDRVSPRTASHGFHRWHQRPGSEHHHDFTISPGDLFSIPIRGEPRGHNGSLCLSRRECTTSNEFEIFESRARSRSVSLSPRLFRLGIRSRFAVSRGGPVTLTPDTVIKVTSYSRLLRVRRVNSLLLVFNYTCGRHSWRGGARAPLMG